MFFLNNKLSLKKYSFNTIIDLISILSKEQVHFILHEQTKYFKNIIIERIISQDFLKELEEVNYNKKVIRDQILKIFDDIDTEVKIRTKKDKELLLSDKKLNRIGFKIKLCYFKRIARKIKLSNDKVNLNRLIKLLLFMLYISKNFGLYKLDLFFLKENNIRESTFYLLVYEATLNYDISHIVKIEKYIRKELKNDIGLYGDILFAGIKGIVMDLSENEFIERLNKEKLK